MKEMLKKYWTHLISYLTLGTLLMIVIFLNQTIIEFTKEIKIISIIMTIILVLCVIGVYLETRYFCDKVTFGDLKLEHSDFHLFLIKNFNIFYIPCFDITHIARDEKHRIKNIIYLATTIIMGIGIIVLLIIFFITPHYEVHTSYDNKYKMLISWDYEKIDTEEQKDYFELKEKNITFVNFNNAEMTSEKVIEAFIEYGNENEKNFKEIEKNSSEIDNKNIVYHVYEMTEEEKKITEVYSTITFDNLDNYIVSIYYRGYSDNYDKQELLDIYKSIELKE